MLIKNRSQVIGVMDIPVLEVFLQWVRHGSLAVARNANFLN